MAAKKKAAAPTTFQEVYAEFKQLAKIQKETSEDHPSLVQPSAEAKALVSLKADLSLILLMLEHLMPGLEHFLYGTPLRGSQKAKAKGAAAGGK